MRQQNKKAKVALIKQDSDPLTGMRKILSNKILMNLIGGQILFPDSKAGGTIQQLFPVIKTLKNMELARKLIFIKLA